MFYAAGRPIYDVDSHLMEMADVLDSYFENAYSRPTTRCLSTNGSIPTRAG